MIRTLSRNRRVGGLPRAPSVIFSIGSGRVGRPALPFRDQWWASTQQGFFMQIQSADYSFSGKRKISGNSDGRGTRTRDNGAFYRCRLRIRRFRLHGMVPNPLDDGRMRADRSLKPGNAQSAKGHFAVFATSRVTGMDGQGFRLHRVSPGSSSPYAQIDNGAA